MTTLHNIISAHEQSHYATNAGNQMHAKLRHIVVDKKTERGDSDIIAKIKNAPELLQFFGADAQTEVPVAGILDHRFISRRIDRMTINHIEKCIKILDYKTDTNRDLRHNQYMAQIREYAELLRMIYPHYQISAYILWTHDFLLENVPIKSL